MGRARPSRTALKIARFVLLLDAVPRLRAVLPEGRAALVESLLRASDVMPAGQIDMMRRPATRRFYEIMEAITGRGQLLWFGLRKRWIAERVEQAIDAGARQLLVVGAGFDALTSSIATRHPTVHCVEIDAPATAEPKRRALETSSLTRENLEVCAADLASRSLSDALASTRWRSDMPSVVVAEGLLMYLARADVERFFTALRTGTGPGTRVACTCVDAHDDGTPRLGTLDLPIRLALRLAGEPMRWGIRPADVPTFFTALGWSVNEQPTIEQLRRHDLAPLGLADEPLAPYEHVVLLEHRR